MKIYLYIGLFLLVAGLAADSRAQQVPFDAAGIQACYSEVQSLKAMVNASDIPRDKAIKLHTLLTKAVWACDKGKVDDGLHYLKEAESLYQQLIGDKQKQAALTSSDFWALATTRWNYISDPSAIQVISGLFNCDSHADYIGIRMHMNEAGQTRLDVLALAKNAKGDTQVAALSLPYDTSAYGLCHKGSGYPEKPEVTLQAAGQNLLDEAGIRGRACPYMLTIDDGLCDKLYLFWPQNVIEDVPENAEDKDVTLLLFRR
jgi:hypothetical protein